MQTALVTRLSTKASAVVAQAKNHPLAQLVTSESTDQQTLLKAVRNVLLRVHFYGPSFTRAIFHAVGRIAVTDLDTARKLAELEFEEAPHPSLAFADYVKMGGDPSVKDQSSPAAFVAAATADMLSRQDSPYAILGFLHLLESTTPAIIETIAQSSKVNPLVQSFDFLSLHRTQDVDHTQRLSEIIAAIEDPAAPQAIEFGQDCFALVYPLPIWTEVLAETVNG
jgi:hypothetical protein